MYYFKDKDNGVGISINKDVVGDITWITEEEFNQIVAENEAKRATAAQQPEEEVNE